MYMQYMFYFSIFLQIHYSLTPLKKTLYETVRKQIKAWHCFAWHYFSLLFLSKSWQALNTGVKMFSKSHHSISNLNFSWNVVKVNEMLKTSELYLTCIPCLKCWIEWYITVQNHPSKIQIELMSYCNWVKLMI